MCSLDIQKNSRILNKEIFIKRAKEIHGDFYVYDDVIYKGMHKKVKIFCKKCDDYFYQTPTGHLQGKSCIKCYSLSKDDFIKKSKEIHGEVKYDYSNINYKGSKYKVNIYCNKHKKEFSQLVSSHIKGCGCPECSKEERTKRKKYTTEFFIERAINIFGDFYSYEKTIYKKSKEKLVVTCRQHGDFYITPNSFLNGKGCPKCNMSSGETRILGFLEELKIDYKPQKKFEECKDKQELPFDFYLPEHNLCIEFDGKQHYKPVDFFGGDKKFKDRKRKDKIKTKFCKDNNIELLRIPYWEQNNIRSILDDMLK